MIEKWFYRQEIRGILMAEGIDGGLLSQVYRPIKSILNPLFV
jgi:hypothetical protein